MKKFLKDIWRQARIQYESSPEGKRHREEIRKLEEEYQKVKEQYKQERKKSKELTRTLKCTTYISMHVDEIDFESAYERYPNLQKAEPDLETFLREWAEKTTPEYKTEIEKWYAQLKPNGKSKQYIRKFIPNCK